MSVDPKFTARELSSMLEGNELLHAATDFNYLMRATVELVKPLFAADLYVCAVCEPTLRHVVGYGWPADCTFQGVTEPLQQYAHQSPLLRYWKQSHDHDRVLRRTDCVDEKQFRRCELYNEVLRPIRLHRQIGTWLRPGGGQHFELGMYRSGRLDFTQRDVARLALIRQSVFRAYRKVLDQQKWTAAPRRWRPMFGPDNVDLQATSLSRGIDDAEPMLPQLPSLTPREREVLHWVVEGKRNAEIATILGTSWRTVRAQLQSIFRKLGVETRTAAAIRAIELGFATHP